MVGAITVLLGSSVLMDGNIPVPSASAEEDMSDLSDIRSPEDQPDQVTCTAPEVKFLSDNFRIYNTRVRSD